MPIFPGPVRHNNADSPILDLTKKQVIGMGIFPSIAGGDGRDGLHANLQTDGYMATILDVNQTYVFLGGVWTDSINWSSVGGSALPGGGEDDDILTRTGEGVGTWKNTLITTGITVKNHDTNPDVSKIVFSRLDTGLATTEGDILGDISALGYKINGNLRHGTPSIRFIAGDVPTTHAYQRANIEFFVSNDAGTDKVFEMSHDKKIVFASIEDDSIPIVVLGGMYYNSTQDNYFVGKVTPSQGQF